MVHYTRLVLLGVLGCGLETSGANLFAPSPPLSADAGADAGNPTGPVSASGDVRPADASTTVRMLHVFASSTVFDGNFGGAAGADAVCQQLATQAHLNGVWMAWVSDAASSPLTRFPTHGDTYALLDGTLLTDSWTALLSKPLAHAIDHDERGQPISFGFMNGTAAWTGTLPAGSAQPDGPGCEGFVRNDVLARPAIFGSLTAVDATWSAAGHENCATRDFHIYCFEN